MWQYPVIGTRRYQCSTASAEVQRRRRRPGGGSRRDAGKTHCHRFAAHYTARFLKRSDTLPDRRRCSAGTFTLTFRRQPAASCGPHPQPPDATQRPTAEPGLVLRTPPSPRTALSQQPEVHTVGARRPGTGASAGLAGAGMVAAARPPGDEWQASARRPELPSTRVGHGADVPARQGGGRTDGVG
jgi:hypothetical protein